MTYLIKRKYLSVIRWNKGNNLYEFSMGRWYVSLSFGRYYIAVGQELRS